MELNKKLFMKRTNSKITINMKAVIKPKVEIMFIKGNMVIMGQIDEILFKEVKIKEIKMFKEIRKRKMIRKRRKTQKRRKIKGNRSTIRKNRKRTRSWTSIRKRRKRTTCWTLIRKRTTCRCKIRKNRKLPKRSPTSIS